MDHDKVLPTIYHIVCVTLWIMTTVLPTIYILFRLHYGSWQGLTYNLSYCLGYIMDHDKVLPTIYIMFGYIMDHDKVLPTI